MQKKARRICPAGVDEKTVRFSSWEVNMAKYCYPEHYTLPFCLCPLRRAMAPLNPLKHLYASSPGVYQCNLLVIINATDNGWVILY